MLLFSTVLLFLPFIEVSCHDRVVVTQSGIEAIYGGVSTKSLLKETAMKSSRSDRSDMPQLDPKSKKEVDKGTVRPCLAIAFVSVAALLTGVLGLIAPLGETRCKWMMLAVALCLVVVCVQMSVGFPIKNELVKRLAEKESPPGSPGAAGDAFAAMMFSVNYTVWFWLWLLVIASSLVPLTIDLFQLRVRKSAASPRFHRRKREIAMSKVEFVCPRCKATILASASLAGEASECPRCFVEIAHWPEPTGSTLLSLDDDSPTPKVGNSKRLIWLATGCAMVVVLSGLGLWGSGFLKSRRSDISAQQATTKKEETHSDGKRTISGRLKFASVNIDDFIEGMKIGANAMKVQPVLPPGFDSSRLKSVPDSSREPDKTSLVQSVRPLLILTMDDGREAYCEFAPREDAYGWMATLETGEKMVVRGVQEGGDDLFVSLKNCERIR
jgi:hypothetical protein